MGFGLLGIGIMKHTQCGDLPLLCGYRKTQCLKKQETGTGFFTTSVNLVKQREGLMTGTVHSSRHNLFMNHKERSGRNAQNYSLLYRLSNQGFLGGSQVNDSDVIDSLRDVFMTHFENVSNQIKYFVYNLFPM